MSDPVPHKSRSDPKAMTEASETARNHRRPAVEVGAHSTLCARAFP